MTGQYNDMLNHSHHVSQKYPQMSRSDRAAQFAPFSALSGYDAAVKETARSTEPRVELGEDEKIALDEKLRLLIDALPACPQVRITYFQPDEKKSGGAYVTATGYIKKLEEPERVIVLKDGQRIHIEEIVGIDSKSFILAI